MNTFEFYKDLFSKELSRKNEIESAVNIPIGIITFIVAVNYYFVSEFNSNISVIIKVILTLIVLSLIISIFFLAKSFNNLFTGFKYQNLPDTKELRLYEKNLKAFNKEVKKKEQEHFEDYLIDNFVNMNDNNLKINRNRLLNLYRGKTFMIISLFLTSIFGIIFILKKI